MRLLIFVALVLRVSSCFGQQPERDSFSKRARNFATAASTDSASYYFDKAIFAAKKINDSSSIAGLLSEKGKLHEAAGSYGPSIQAYIEGLNIAKRIHDKLHEGLCYMGLCSANFRVANNEVAWGQGLEALKCFESLHDTAHYIVASMAVAQIEISLGKLDQADAIYTQMLSVAKQIRDSALIADNLDHLGVIRSFKKEFAAALPFHEQSLEINKKINNAFNTAINYANIGEIYMRMKDYSKALKYLTAALELEKTLDAKSVMIFNYYTLGECFSLMGKPTQALENFQTSLSLIDQVGETRERPTVYQLMSEHYERNNDDARSLQYFRKFSTERDSLRIASSSYAMEELKMIYEADRRENDLRSALLENNLKESRIENGVQTIHVLYLTIGTAIVGLLITVVLAVRLYKNERKLRLANKTKDALLSIIGHDLRGPMTNIKQLTQLIKLSEGAEREECIRMIEKPVNAAVNLLDDLLAWSRSARQQSTLVKSNIQVRHLVEHTVELITDQAASKQIRIKVNVPEDATVYADINHVSSILRNLISNSIKFTPTNGNITIDHDVIGDAVSIRVSDSGIGIEPQNIKRILSARFYSTQGTQDEKGSGFGLMLIQEFLRLNNGTLHIDSQVGKGTTMSFTLPAS